MFCYCCFSFLSWVENCCTCLASWLMQRTVLLQSVLLNFSFYKIPVNLFKISQVSAIFGGDFATTPIFSSLFKINQIHRWAPKSGLNCALKRRNFNHPFYELPRALTAFSRAQMLPYPTLVSYQSTSFRPSHQWIGSGAALRHLAATTCRLYK